MVILFRETFPNRCFFCGKEIPEGTYLVTIGVHNGNTVYAHPKCVVSQLVKEIKNLDNQNITLSEIANCLYKESDTVSDSPSISERLREEDRFRRERERLYEHYGFNDEEREIIENSLEDLRRRILGEE